MPGLKPERAIPPEDRLERENRRIADMLGLSHRLYRELRAQAYRWSHLAPATLRVVEQAVEERWSTEKTAEWMDATPSEAEKCLKRFRMSLYIEQGKDAGDRICRAIASWLSRFEELSKGEREALAKDLALHLANQLDWADAKGHTLRQVAESLEPPVDSNPGDPLGSGKPGDPEAPPRWGPAWKD